MTIKGMLSKGESKRAEDHAHPGSPTVRGRHCAGPNYLIKASQGFWAVKRWEVKEFTQSHIAGIGEQDLNANLLGCKAPACFTALSLGSGVHAAQQWEGVQTASLFRLVEQQSHFLSPFLSSSIFALLQESHSFHTRPPLSGWLFLIIFSPSPTLSPGLHPPPTQWNLLMPRV